MNSLFFPLFSTIIVYVIFSLLLKKRIGKNIFCELGFIYLSLLLVYTILPGFVFIYGIMKPGDPIAVLMDQVSISTADLNKHFWRHFLFFISFSIGYYFFRGREAIEMQPIKKSYDTTIFTLIIIIIFCMLFLSIMSAPVESYYDNYVRYEHLPSVLRILASALIRFKSGFYVILLTLMFSNFNRYKKIIPISVLLICLYELLYSHGSRIYLFVILLQTFFLYNYNIKTIQIKKVVIYILPIVFLFSAIESLRVLGDDKSNAKEVITKEGIKPPGELGAIFMPSFHLYKERNNGTLPKKDWQMFFYDIISPFTLNSFTKWNPIYWYANNYFPESTVPPFTIGPIADSAIWGGEIDLFFRGLLNGAFFAYLVTFFIKRREKWWAVTIYAFFFSNAVITLKYSVFYYLTPLTKDLFPTLLIVGFIMLLFRSKKNTIIPESVTL